MSEFYIIKIKKSETIEEIKLKIEITCKTCHNTINIYCDYRDIDLRPKHWYDQLLDFKKDTTINETYSSTSHIFQCKYNSHSIADLLEEYQENANKPLFKNPEYQGMTTDQAFKYWLKTQDNVELIKIKNDIFTLKTDISNIIKNFNEHKKYSDHSFENIQEQLIKMAEIIDGKRDDTYEDTYK
jgi:hypothetical protein